jgi:hypothetical protein
MLAFVPYAIAGALRAVVLGLRAAGMSMAAWQSWLGDGLSDDQLMVTDVAPGAVLTPPQ